MLHFMVLGCSAAISFVFCFIFWSASKVHGWEYYKYYVWITAATVLYGICGLPVGSVTLAGDYPRIFNLGTVLISMLASAMWLYFCREQTRSQEGASEFSIGEKIAIATMILGAIAAILTVPILGEMRQIGPTWAGQVYHIPHTRFAGNVLIGAMFFSLSSVVYRYARRCWRGENRPFFPLLASLAFLLGALEEALVILDLLSLPLLGAGAFSLGNVLMATGLANRVVANAHSLEHLNTELKARVVASTNELMSTQQALMVSERHAAMGSLAAGVSHEINNPLAYISGNLEFVRDGLEKLPARAEELDAVNDAMTSVERIQDAVINQKLYVQPQGREGVADVNKTIEIAVRMVRPQTRFSSTLEVAIEASMEAAIDESRLVQVVVNLLLIASRFNSADRNRSATTLWAFRDEAAVCIEITNNEAIAEAVLRTEKESGFGASESFTRTDIAVFVCRGIVEACGGTLTNAERSGIGVVRVQLPSVREENRPSTQSNILA